MRYKFSQVSGNSTRLLILENVEIKNGAVYGTKIGKFAGWDDETKEELYAICPPVKFIAGGGPWDLTEYTGTLK